MTEFIFSQNYAIWRNEGLSKMVESMNPKTFEYEVGLSQIIEEGPKKKMVSNEDELRKNPELISATIKGNNNFWKTTWKGR